MKVVTCCSFKGGTAKTSVVLHLGAILAKEHGYKVLLIDLDAQGNLTSGLGATPDTYDAISTVLQNEKSLPEVIIKSGVDNLDLVAANVFLDGIETTSYIVNDLYGHERLKKAIKGSSLDYDYVLIDTPPSLGWLTQSAFFAADYSIICCLPEPYSILALGRLREYHEKVREHNPIKLLGLVLSFWDPRGAHNSAYVNSIESAFEGSLFTTKIRRDRNVSKAALVGEPVIVTSPKSRASADYRALTKEFLKKAIALQATY